MKLKHEPNRQTAKPFKNGFNDLVHAWVEALVTPRELLRIELNFP